MVVVTINTTLMIVLPLPSLKKNEQEDIKIHLKGLIIKIGDKVMTRFIKKT